MKYPLLLIFLFAAMSVYSQADQDIYDLFDSQFIDVDGYKINVETLGTGDPIFFFAGVYSSDL